MNKYSINTIDINCLEYTDKHYGNSYFIAQITTNYGQSTQGHYKTDYQYGYGSQYEYESLKVLKCVYDIKTNTNALWKFCADNGIILRTTKESATQRQIKEVEVLNFFKSVNIREVKI